MAALRFSGSIVFCVCLASLVAAGCRRSVGTASDISVQETITPQPLQVGDATIAIQLGDASYKPVTHATISVEGDMSHPGMSPVFGTASETAPGSYTAHLNFDMAGDWVVLLHIRLADGRTIERQIDVRGVGSNG
jgi:hypothetical protein